MSRRPHAPSEAARKTAKTGPQVAPASLFDVMEFTPMTALAR